MSQNRIRTGFVKLPYILASLILVLLGSVIYHLWTSRIIDIDNNFDGLSESSNLETQKTLRLLVVHGIGSHCLGYSNSFEREIARRLDLEVPEEDYNELIKNYAEKIHQKYNDDLKKDSSKESSEEPPNLVNDHCLEVRSGKKNKNEDPYSNIEQAASSTCRSIRKDPNIQIDCQKIKLEFDPKQVGIEGKTPHATVPYTLGYIRTQDYFGKNQSNSSTPRLRVYELLWDPATRWAKDYYISHDQQFYNNSREWVNKDLKTQIINGSISDAILYLGEYRPLIQYTFLQGFCKLATDRGKLITNRRTGDNLSFKCPLAKKDTNNLQVPNPKEFAQNNDIVIVSHSLSTRIVFDTLGLLGQESFVTDTFNKLKKIRVKDFQKSSPDEKLKDAAKKIRDIFAVGLKKLFVLANQVPLIDLSGIEHPFNFGVGKNVRELGKGFNKFLEVRRREQLKFLGKDQYTPLQIVAFTDPNDLLSYNLKCWYYQHIIRATTAQEIAEQYATKNPSWIKPWK